MNSHISARYECEGFATFGVMFDRSELDALADEADRLASLPTDDRVLEKDGHTVRALHGCHRTSALMKTLTQLPRTLGVARALLQGDVYVYQFKINTKAAHSGGAWAWHRDYIYWREEDGMPECSATNIAIFLDDTTDLNGPLMVIPRSHLSVDAQGADATHREGSSWQDHVSEDLKYTLPAGEVTRLTGACDQRALTGSAGTVIAFNPNLAHSSLANRSGQRRRLLIITYNRSDNAPTHVYRPEFLVSRDTSPLALAGRDGLLENEPSESLASPQSV